MCFKQALVFVNLTVRLPSRIVPHCGRLPALGLSSSFNLGKADIYPRTSGKATALSRLLPRLFLHPSQCVVLFDDDNDLGMADLCASGRRIDHEEVHSWLCVL